MFRVLNVCFLLFAIATLAVVSGCASDAPAPSEQAPGVAGTQVQIGMVVAQQTLGKDIRIIVATRFD